MLCIGICIDIFIQKQIVAHRPNYMLIYNFKTYKYIKHSNIAHQIH